MGWVLYYDGGCNLCHESQQLVSRWAEVAGAQLIVRTLSEAPSDVAGDRRALVLEADGEVFRGGDAWLKLLRIAPKSIRWLALVDRFAFGRALAAFAYVVVARLRYLIRGRRMGACSVHRGKNSEQTKR